MTGPDSIFAELEQDRQRFLRGYTRVFALCMVGVASVLLTRTLMLGEQPLQIVVNVTVAVTGLVTWLLAPRMPPERIIPVQLGVSMSGLTAIYLALPDRTTVAVFTIPVALMALLALRVRIGLTLAGGMALLISLATLARPGPSSVQEITDLGLALVASLVIALVVRLQYRREAAQLAEAYQALTDVRTDLLHTAERAEAAAREAVAANAAKSRFLASMSHELRTPLNAMLGYTELVREEADLDADGDADLQRVQQAGNHLLGLIDDVLDLARVESGGRAAEPQSFNLGACAAEAASWIRPTVEESGNQLALELVPLQLESDPVLIRQILLNLLGNAIRHTTRGTITLRLREEAESVVLEVEDEGEGIASDELPTVFEPFRRGKNVSTRAAGAGLGLALVDRFVTTLGGTVEVRSELGVGTCFTVRLPRFPANLDASLATAVSPTKRPETPR